MGMAGGGEGECDMVVDPTSPAVLLLVGAVAVSALMKLIAIVLIVRGARKGESP